MAGGSWSVLYQMSGRSSPLLQAGKADVAAAICAGPLLAPLRRGLRSDSWGQARPQGGGAVHGVGGVMAVALGAECAAAADVYDSC